MKTTTGRQRPACPVCFGWDCVELDIGLDAYKCLKCLTKMPPELLLQPSPWLYPGAEQRAKDADQLRRAADLLERSSKL